MFDVSPERLKRIYRNILWDMDQAEQDARGFEEGEVESLMDELKRQEFVPIVAIKALHAKLKALESELAFYADHNNWAEREDENALLAPAEFDAGKRARRVLQTD